MKINALLTLAIWLESVKNVTDKKISAFFSFLSPLSSGYQMVLTLWLKPGFITAANCPSVPASSLVFPRPWEGGAEKELKDLRAFFLQIKLFSMGHYEGYSRGSEGFILLCGSILDFFSPFFWG